MPLIPHGTRPADLPEAFARLLKRLRAYSVLGWEHDSEGPTWPAIDREVALVSEADVVSSEIEKSGGTFGSPKPRHIVALDIDYPVYLVESSTPGHHHLYLDVPGGVEHADYMRLLEVLGQMGVIQKGYARVSLEREHSDLRLPWVAKARPGDPA